MELEKSWYKKRILSCVEMLVKSWETNDLEADCNNMTGLF